MFSNSRVTRRQVLQLIGASAGGAAVMNTMTAWGHMPVAAQTTPPKLDGNGNGTKVIVLGAGPGGCPAAWELVKLGYDVTVIEARDRLGGHAFTVRGGSRHTEYGKGEEVCTWDEGLWYDAGPSRIPFYHQGFFHYAKEFNIPLIDHKNLNLNAWVYMEDVAGPLNAKRMRLHEMQADMAGYTSELLAKAINKDQLDSPLTAEEDDMLIDYLVNWGMISAKDLTYRGTDTRGYDVLPDTQSPGKIGTPPSLSDWLPVASAALQWQGGYLSAAATFDWQTTLVKPKEGIGQLYEEGFKQALGERVHLNCKVNEIRQSDDGVRIVYEDTTSGEVQEITGDYCLCNIPLSVLLRIPSDFSSDMKAAIQGVPYDMAIRMGVGYKRRFWEEDDQIYGGQSFTNLPELSILGYPDNDYHAQKGVLLNAYAWGTDAAHLSTFSYQERIDRILDIGVKIHPQMKDEYESGFSVAWHLEPYSLGAWPNYNERSRTQFFPRLQEPDGRVYLVGEHLSYVNAWIEGAVQSAWLQVEKLHSRVMQG